VKEEMPPEEEGEEEKHLDFFPSLTHSDLKEPAKYRPATPKQAREGWEWIQD
jgi:hypothetical protein